MSLWVYIYGEDIQIPVRVTSTRKKRRNSRLTNSAL